MSKFPSSHVHAARSLTPKGIFFNAPTGETPAGTSNGSATGGESAKVTHASGSMKVKVGDGEYTVDQLVEAARRGALLAQHTEVLANEQATPAQRAASMRFVLGQTRTPEQVEEIMAQMETGGEEDPQPRNGRGKGGAPDPNAALMAKLEELTQEVHRLKGGAQDMRYKELRANLTNGIEAALGGKDFQDILKRVREVKGEDAATNFSNYVREQAYSKAQEGIATRTRLAGGSFQEAWLGEAAAEAVTNLSKQLGPVIVDPSLGRAPETVGGEDIFLPEKPVERPKAGTDPATAQANLADWTKDFLLRGVKETAGAGPTKA